MESAGRAIRVLHVDDELDFLELASTFLERTSDRMTVDIANDASDGLDHLQDSDYDCIVSDFDMPGHNGIEFLESVRTDQPDLPFILYTGKGSEEVASDAISAGVTDYLQKEVGSSQFTVLANRIENAVGQYHAEQAIEETEHRYQRLIEESSDIITIVDANGDFEYISPAAERLLGYSADDLVGENGFSFVHPEDREETMQRFTQLVMDASTRITSEFRFELPDGDWIWVEAKGRNLLDDPVIDGVVVSVRDLTERKEQEEALRREHDRFYALFEELGDPIVEATFDGDTPIVTAINDAFEDVFGVEPYDLVGEPLDDHVVPVGEDESVACLNRRIRNGERVERELERQTEIGPRTFLFRNVPFSVHGEQRAFGIYLDITERRQQQERFKAFIEHSMDLIAVLNTDGTFQYQSPSGAEMLGYGEGALIGESVFDYIHPDDQEDVLAEFDRAVEDPDVLPSAEFRFKHHDGSWRWLESIGNNQLENPAIEGIIVNSRDITDRKEYEQRLRTLHDATEAMLNAESKQEIAEIASNTATSVLALPVNGVHLYDENDGTLVPVAISAANKEIIGTPPTLHPGEGLAGQVYDTGIAQFHADVRSSSEKFNPDTVIRSEIILPLGDHGVFFISSTEVDDFDDVDSALAQVLAATVEATLDRAERQAELEDQTRELNNQNERLERFASVVSHDLRNPLNVATGHLDLARRDCDSPHLDKIEQAHDRMGRLIEDVLTLARQDEQVAEFDQVYLATIAEESWQNVATKRATLEVDVDHSILADYSRLQQLLENLFRNSVEHGFTNNRDVSRLDAVEDGGAGVTITVSPCADGAGFSISDDGPGISRDNWEHVFQSGYSTQTDGTGLGLAIVREIVTAHGWEISVTESETGGARFDITNVERVDA